MARTFAYLRVSTPEQTTENQVQEITASGFRVEPHIVVTKLDRLGHNAMDVAAAVAGLDKAGESGTARAPIFASRSRNSSPGAPRVGKLRLCRHIRAKGIEGQLECGSVQYVTEPMFGTPTSM